MGVAGSKEKDPWDIRDEALKRNERKNRLQAWRWRGKGENWLSNMKKVNDNVVNEEVKLRLKVNEETDWGEMYKAEGFFSEYIYNTMGTTLDRYNEDWDEEYDEKALFDREILKIPVDTVPFLGYEQGIYGEILYNLARNDVAPHYIEDGMEWFYEKGKGAEIAREYFTDYEGFYKRLGLDVKEQNMPGYYYKVKKYMLKQ